MGCLVRQRLIWWSHILKDNVPGFDFRFVPVPSGQTLHPVGYSAGGLLLLLANGASAGQ